MSDKFGFKSKASNKKNTINKECYLSFIQSMTVIHKTKMGDISSIQQKYIICRRH